MDPRKQTVREAYDAIAETWGRGRDAMDDPRERAWLERFCSSLTGARVLDLGCGGGAITTRMVARGLRVTGVDFSRAQLNHARVACPSAMLVQGDLAEVEFAPASFDGVNVYDSLWHLPREEHGPVLARIRRWVIEGAFLLLTVGALDPGDPGRAAYTALRCTDLLRRLAARHDIQSAAWRPFRPGLLRRRAGQRVGCARPRRLTHGERQRRAKAPYCTNRGE